MATTNSSDLRLKLLILQHIARFLPAQNRICFRITCESFSDLAEHALYNAILRPKRSRYLLNVTDDGSPNTTKAVQSKWQTLILDMVETNLHALTNLTGLFVRLPMFYESAEILQQLKSVLRQLCTSNAATIVALGWIFNESFYKYSIDQAKDLITVSNAILLKVPSFGYRDVLEVSLSLPHLSTLYLPSFKIMQSRLYLLDDEKFNQLWSLLEPEINARNSDGEILPPPFKNLRQLHFSDNAFEIRDCLSGEKQRHIVAAFAGLELVTVSSLYMIDNLAATDKTFRKLPHNVLQNLFPNAAVIMPREVKIGITLSTPAVNRNKAGSDSEDEPNARYSFCELVDQACCSVLQQQLILDIEAPYWQHFLGSFYRLERLYAGFSNKYRHIKIVLRIRELSYVPWSFVAKLIRLCRNIRVVYEIVDNQPPDDGLSIRHIPDSIANILDARRTVQAVQPHDTLADAYYADFVKSKFGWMQVKHQVIPVPFRNF